MAKSVIGLFDTFTEAQGVVQDLVNSGFPREDISFVASDAEGKYANYRADADTTEMSGAATGATAGAVIGGLGGLLVGLGALAIPGVGPVIAAGPLVATLAGAGVGAVAGGLIGALTDIGVPEEEAQYYAEGVRRGGVLVTVRADDDKADRAVDIMRRHGAADIDQRGETWRQSGWTGFDTRATPYSLEEQRQERERYRTTHAATSTPAASQGERSIPVVEEELQVGKRQVQRGGVRVYTRATEKPVEEQVRLREEHIKVERRPVDRPVTAADKDAFKERTVELSETDEEAVVSKRARVVEEVVVGKDVEHRTETVRDKVRRTDVEVEQLGSQQARGTTGFDAYETDFRQHFTTTFGSKGKNYTYDRYTPAYRYGYELASDKRYSGNEWNAVETQARRDWEARYQGQSTWEDVKDAIRYAWDKVRGRPGARY